MKQKQVKGLGTMYQMPEGYGHYFGRPKHDTNWGTESLVLFLTILSARWSLIAPAHPFGIGDMLSNSHKSHFDGKAVDIYLIHKNGVKREDYQNVVTYVSPNYDFNLNLRLAKEIAALSKVFPFIQFLYDDAKVIKQVPMIQSKKEYPHSEHMHVLLTGQHPYSKDRVAEMMRIKSTL